jgi:hypothetical protein
MGEASCFYWLDGTAADFTVRCSWSNRRSAAWSHRSARALAASTLTRLVSGLGCASVSTEAEGLLATGEQAVVMRLHIRPRENPLCGALSDRPSGDHKPTHAFDRMHAHQQFALAQEFQGEGFTQSLVTHCLRSSAVSRGTHRIHPSDNPRFYGRGAWLYFNRLLM